MLVRMVTAKRRGRSAPIGTPALDGLHRGFEHGFAAECVHVDELHAGHGCRGKHGASNGVGNVVEFQVEKNARAQCGNFLDGGGPAAVKSWLPILNMPTRSATCCANSAPWIENQNQARRSDCCGMGVEVVVVIGDPDSFGVSASRQLQELEPYLAHAGMDQADFPGDTIGYINFAPFLIGPRSLIRTNSNLPFRVFTTRTTEPKGRLGCGGSEGFRVEALAIGGFAAIEPGAIPTGITPPRS